MSNQDRRDRRDPTYVSLLTRCSEVAFVPTLLAKALVTAFVAALLSTLLASAYLVGPALAQEPAPEDPPTRAEIDAVRDAEEAPQDLTPTQLSDARSGSKPPVVRNDVYTGWEGRTLLRKSGGGVLANDPNGPSIRARFVLGVEHGSLQLNADGSFIYRPDPNFSGVDYFKYRGCFKSRPNLCSAAALVKITVRGVNDAPVAAADSYSMREDGFLSIQPRGVLSNDRDPEGSGLVVAGITNKPDHGYLNIDRDGSFTYNPKDNFRGKDSYTYLAGDASGSRDAATVTITVQSLPDPPDARYDVFSTPKNTPKSVGSPGLLRNDREPDGQTMRVISYTQPPRGGTTVFTGGGFNFRPDAGFTGKTTFRYTVSDGTRRYDDAAVTVKVGG